MHNVMDISSEMYPVLLKKIPNPPEKLYYKGEYRKELFENCLGVVGSRSMSPYGERVVKWLLSGLVPSGITIVSGFMYGIDALAHTTALELNIPTIAVMACGVDKIYPSNQETLYKNILSSKGLVLSECKDDLVPNKWVFPRRNRIVAGLCRAVLVIEASLNSGSLITARLANEYERKVFSVPGSIFSGVSQGTNFLLDSYGISITSSRVLLEHFYDDSYTLSNNVSVVDQECVKAPLDDTVSFEHDIYKFLETTPSSLEELTVVFGKKYENMNTIVTLMEIQGRIKNIMGIYYVC